MKTLRNVTLLRTFEPLHIPGYGQAGGQSPIVLHGATPNKPGIEEMLLTEAGVLIKSKKFEVVIPNGTFSMAVLAPENAPVKKEEPKKPESKKD